MYIYAYYKVYHKATQKKKAIGVPNTHIHHYTHAQKKNIPPRKNLNPSPGTHIVLGVDVGPPGQERRRHSAVAVVCCQVQRRVPELHSRGRRGRARVRDMAASARAQACVRARARVREGGWREGGCVCVCVCHIFKYMYNEIRICMYQICTNIYT